MAANFEEVISKAVADRAIPGVVLLAENKTGSFHYEKVLGHSSIEAGKEVPLRLDSVFMFMSMTKLITIIAALQAVERGLWDLDADVAPVLPELAALPVLEGFNEDKTPKLVPRRHPITLRLLLTHSAGVGYDFLHPALLRYRDWAEAQPAERLKELGVAPMPKISQTLPSVEARFNYPLVFQPGEGWTYGAGIDWVGRLVERVRGKAEDHSEGGVVPLEDLVVRDVLQPLGLPAGALTFHPERHPEVLKRLWPSLPVRADPAGPVAHGPSLYRAAPAALGGQGLYGDMPSFLAVLRSLLRDDGKLLQPETAQLLFEPQLPTDAARKELLHNTEHPEWITGDVPNTGEYDWSLGGLLVTGSSHPARQKGAVFWAGAINLAWIIDRQAGLAAIFASNFQPAGDAQGKALMRAWEAFVYPQAAKL